MSLGPRKECHCLRWSTPCTYHQGWDDALEWAMPVMTENAIDEARRTMQLPRLPKPDDTGRWPWKK